MRKIDRLIRSYKNLNPYSDHVKDLQWLINRVRRLEEALSFYANKDNWKSDIPQTSTQTFDVYLTEAMSLDRGTKARRALEESVSDDTNS